jgi:hypothetical protein
MEKRLTVCDKRTGQMFQVLDTDAYYIVPLAWCGEVLGKLDLAFRKEDFTVVVEEPEDVDPV